MPDASPADPSETSDTAYQVRLMPGQQTFTAAASVPLLLAAEAAGVSMKSSCRNGTCRACLAQLVSGAITYRIEWPGVSADEKRIGMILPCVACAASDVVLGPPDETPVTQVDAGPAAVPATPSAALPCGRPMEASRPQASD